jgi:hypothetical protein
MSHCHLPTNHPSIIHTVIHTPHKTPLVHNHRFLLATMLDNIINNFNLARFYFSNPPTCPTTFIQYYLPHKRDNICSSIGLVFSHQSNGNGLVYITSPKPMPKTVKWARLTAKQTPIHPPYSSSTTMIDCTTHSTQSNTGCSFNYNN